MILKIYQHFKSTFYNYLWHIIYDKNIHCNVTVDFVFDEFNILYVIKMKAGDCVRVFLFS